MTITLDLDEAAAVALATVIRRLRPEEYADTLATYGVDVAAWYRAIDALSPLLPAQPEARFPGEPESLADIGRQRSSGERGERLRGG